VPPYSGDSRAYFLALPTRRADAREIDSIPATLRARGGQRLVTDGPAAEIKEFLGGYAVVECADLDEGLRWAASIQVTLSGGRSGEDRFSNQVQVPSLWLTKHLRKGCRHRRRTAKEKL
jgi:YCII-related domain-containing protein